MTCYASAAACAAANSGCTCNDAPKYCPAGVSSGFTYICPSTIRCVDSMSLSMTVSVALATGADMTIFRFPASPLCSAGGVPTGFGAQCFSSQSACQIGGLCNSLFPCTQNFQVRASTALCRSRRDTCTTEPVSRCVARAFVTFPTTAVERPCQVCAERLPVGPCPLPPSQICATGVAGSVTTSTVSWFCGLDLPAAALPTGSGRLCFETFASCMTGPNLCDMTTPCELDLNACATGMAGGIVSPAHNWWDPSPCCRAGC